MIKSQMKFIKRYWLLGIFGTLAIPSIFLGFDQHHGGLIHATLTTTRAAYFNEGDLPFNQYGPFWVFIYGLFYIVIPPDYSFLSIKLFTFFLSAITIYITYKLATKYLDRQRSYLVALLMLATYPFYSGNLPWPSSITMFTIPLIGLVLNRILHKDTSLATKTRILTIKNDRILLLLLGFLVATVFQTRVQIGFLLLFFVAYFLSRSNFRKESFYRLFFLIGFFVTNLFTYSILFLKGWLTDSLSDQFIFGASYITGDKSTYPMPKWTILLTVSFTFIYFGILRIKKVKISRTLSWVTLCFSLLLLLVYIIEISLKNERFSLAAHIIWKRFWISLLLSSALIYLVKFIRHKYRTRVINSDYSEQIILIGLSLISLVQSFPLFDEMHAWWGSTPGFILVILILGDIRNKISGNLFPKLIFVCYFLFSIVIGAVAVGNAVVNSGQSKFAPGLKGIYIDKQNLELQLSISKFLGGSVPKSSTVLNLCTNPNIFFDSQYDSASRSIVFWTPIFANENLRSNILNSKPERVLTCSTTTNPMFEADYLRDQEQALKSISTKPKLVAVMLDADGSKWKIWIP